MAEKDQAKLISCPSCNSRDWKSARLIVLEGITTTTGEVSGDVTDPGAFSGGIREFLLSDRWFSWDYKIDADVSLKSITGLASEIRKLMLTRANDLRLPTPPLKQEFRKVWNEPTKPLDVGDIFGEYKLLSEEVKFGIFLPDPESLKPEPFVEPAKKSWLSLFVINLVSLLFMFVAFLFAVLFFSGSLHDLNDPEHGIIGVQSMQALLAYIAIFLFAAALTTSPKRRQKAATERAKRKYDSKMVVYRKALENYQVAILQVEANKAHNEEVRKRHAADIEHYEERYSAWQKETRDFEMKCKTAQRSYNDLFDQYESKKKEILEQRELLWDRARVCSRCGTAYFP